MTTNGNELVQLCRQYTKEVVGAEKVLDDLVLCLTHEHELRQLLHLLPETGHLHFDYSRVLFASFFYGFMNYPTLVKNTTIQDRLKKAKFEITEEGQTTYVQLLQEFLEPVKAGFAASERRQPPKEEAKRKVYEKVVRKSLVFRERLKEYLACVSLDASMQPSELLAENRETVGDWADQLDPMPGVSTKLINNIKKQLEKIPFEVTDVMLEKLENLFLSQNFARLNDQEKDRLSDFMGVLLIDEDAFGNFVWLLSENAFSLQEDWQAHNQFVGHLDLIRCFHTQSVDVLHRFIQLVSQVPVGEREPFFKLLDLKVLNQAAALSIEKLKKQPAKAK